MKNSEGTVFILSGPSGSGKDTLLSALLQKNPEIRFSISSVTRTMRCGEKNGEKYNFISREVFESMIAQGEMLEYADYCGNYYGTPRRPIEQWLAQGRSVMIEVEIKGAAKLRALMPEAVNIFILPPSLKVLQERLYGRRTENEETARKRLRSAADEIACAPEYDYIVINDNLDQAVDALAAIVRAERAKTWRMMNYVNEVLKDAESFHW